MYSGLVEAVEAVSCCGEEHLLKASSSDEHILGVVVFCWPEQCQPELLAPAPSVVCCCSPPLPALF